MMEIDSTSKCQEVLTMTKKCKPSIIADQATFDRIFQDQEGDGVSYDCLDAFTLDELQSIFPGVTKNVPKWIMEELEEPSGGCSMSYDKEKACLFLQEEPVSCRLGTYNGTKWTSGKWHL